MTTKGISPWSEIFKRTSLKANFCPDCGTILDLPGVSPTILCNLCGYSISTKELYSKEVVLQRKAKEEARKFGDDNEEEKHSTIQEKCIECDNDTVYFYTQQTRSVDEGSTVFYECTKCGVKWNVNN